MTWKVQEEESSRTPDTKLNVNWKDIGIMQASAKQFPQTSPFCMQETTIILFLGLL
jgi:hypothetical protein